MCYYLQRDLPFGAYAKSCSARTGLDEGTAPSIVSRHPHPIAAAGRAAPATRMILGRESGTGKEITAQLVHNLSSRKNGPYLPVNCAAIPETLIESQLFGHEKGSFTGADRRHEGLFERACGGTLLLDEFTEMRCETQAKLLSVLEEGTLLRVGGTKEIPINVRVLAATNRSIDRALRGGLLRDDLYFPLKIFSVHLPPLRERIEDLPFLIEHFIQRTNEKHGRRITSIHDDCLNALAAYRWRGISAN
jgi:two-component system, NtrC family, response regulator AtoC